MKMVVKPVAKRIWRKRVRSEAPRTISGVAIGRKTRRFVEPRARKRWRTSASATSVPSTVAITVEISAISSERITASRIPGTASQLIQLSKVKACQV